MNEADVKHLLETAARTTPHELDPVAAVLRRRGSARRRTVMAGTGALAACAAAVLTLSSLSTPNPTHVRPVPPAGTASTSSAPTWAPPTIDTDEHGINGVHVTAPGYAPQRVPANPDGSTPCLKAGTIAVYSTTTTGAPESCDRYLPGAQVTPMDRLDWQFGYPASPGLTLLDGVPVFITSMPYGQESQATLTAPTRRVQVRVSGDEDQVRTLLSSITIDSRPSERLAPARASQTSLALARITDSEGSYSGQSTNPDLLDRLAGVVDSAAPVQGEPACLPALANFVQVDLQTTTGSVPGEDPVQEFTYLAADITGQCPLVFSSTGAVVQPDSSAFLEALQQLRTSQDQG
jgi:hypothetical protein